MFKHVGSVWIHSRGGSRKLLWITGQDLPFIPFLVGGSSSSKPSFSCNTRQNEKTPLCELRSFAVFFPEEGLVYKWKSSPNGGSREHKVPSINRSTSNMFEKQPEGHCGKKRQCNRRWGPGSDRRGGESTGLSGLWLLWSVKGHASPRFSLKNTVKWRAQIMIIPYDAIPINFATYKTIPYPVLKVLKSTN